MRLFKEYKTLFIMLLLCVVASIMYLLTGDTSPVFALPIVFGISNTMLYRMPSGIAGDVGRKFVSTIEAGIFDTSYPCLLHGILVKYVAGKVRPIANADVIASVQQGFLCRPYPFQEPQGSSAASELLGGGVPNLTHPANILKSGYMTVQLGNTLGTLHQGATAYANIVKGDAVYCRKTASGVGTVGDIEAGSISGNEAITLCYFMGPADAAGNVEIAFNI